MENRKADGEKQWEQSLQCKREDELLQHLIFLFIFLFIWFFGGQLANDV